MRGAFPDTIGKLPNSCSCCKSKFGRVSHQPKIHFHQKRRPEMHSLWRSQNRYSCLCLMAALVVFLSLNASAQDWPQWALNPQHTEFLRETTAQPLGRNLVNLVYDFNTDAEKADPNAGGTLLVHYQVPLIDDNDVFIESKDGTYSNSTYSTQKWHQNKYSWRDGHFAKVWTFNTDWFAPGSSNDFWEPVYHA